MIEILKENKTLKYLFVNPNAQNYLIDKDLINEMEIKGINTCSTGTNHIDIEYCNKKNIEVIKIIKIVRKRSFGDFEIIEILKIICLEHPKANL